MGKLPRRIVEIVKSIGGPAEFGTVRLTLDCGHRRTMTLLGWVRRYPGGMDSTIECNRSHPNEGLTVGERLRRLGQMR